MRSVSGQSSVSNNTMSRGSTRLIQRKAHNMMSSGVTVALAPNNSRARCRPDGVIVAITTGPKPSSARINRCAVLTSPTDAHHTTMGRPFSDSGGKPKRAGRSSHQPRLNSPPTNATSNASGSSSVPSTA